MLTKVLQLDTRKDILWVSLSIIGVCVCVYVYLVTATVRNVVSKREMAKQITSMTEQLSTKEFDLISMESKITLSYASSLGFSEAKQKVFITPASVSFISTLPSPAPSSPL